jgi:hypothetical protein
MDSNKRELLPSGPSGMRISYSFHFLSGDGEEGDEEEDDDGEGLDISMFRQNPEVCMAGWGSRIGLHCTP